MTREQLRRAIIKSLRQEGFRINGKKLLPPRHIDKGTLRTMHSAAVAHRIGGRRKGLERYEDVLLKHIANGCEVDPDNMLPRLIQIMSGSEEELLFRYASLHWSIPVSSGYGRRLRFLVIDDSTQKLIGILGLGDPVFNLGARDNWVGWGNRTRCERLQHVMDAYVLGAVPPYSSLLCGKLVAMLAASDQVRLAFKRKYGRTRSRIRGKTLDGRLALITTTSALGRSSIYNRLRFHDRLMYESVGFTRGSGDFHFLNGTYEAIREYAEQSCQPTAKQKRWGTGFRNRREVIKKCLAELGLSTEWLYHGIRREVFVVPLARNAREFLRGEHSRLRWLCQPAEEITAWFSERWLLPRAKRVPDYVDFDREEYRIWPRPT